MWVILVMVRSFELLWIVLLLLLCNFWVCLYMSIKSFKFLKYLLIKRYIGSFGFFGYFFKYLIFKIKEIKFFKFFMEYLYILIFKRWFYSDNNYNELKLMWIEVFILINLFVCF